MPVRFNHTIVAAHDREASARFFSELFDVAPPAEAGIFLAVELADDVQLLFAEPGTEFSPQHYAFLVGDEDFDGILERIRERDMPHWADPRRARTGINHNHGGRGVYFQDPSGHFLEAITRLYGSA